LRVMKALYLHITFIYICIDVAWYV
jgi:hypothetical protein